jgi:adenosylmethionine-8-amino-7-oxononanoate aminotransferase
MSVSGRSIFTQAFNGLLFEVDFIPFPDKNNAAASVAVLEKLLKQGDTAALIVEPLVQGAAGMRMYPASVLEQYFSLCKQYQTLIIADEVMTGFGRTGQLFATQNVTTTPDIICLSKGITGGTMPLGVTACAQHVYDAFYDDDLTKTLYHGHSFTANPLACTAALASLDLLLDTECEENRKRIAASHTAFAQKMQNHKGISHIRQTGTILAIELNTTQPTDYNNPQREFIYRFFLQRNILLRPLGNIIYLLPPYCITNEQLQYIYETIEELVNCV